MTTTSLDSNVVIALLNQDPALNLPILKALQEARHSGAIVVSGPVYAELLGLPARTAETLDAFFSFGKIGIEWVLDEPIWRLAGEAYQRYVKRRLAHTGTLPRRILTDFLIGAHASIRGYRLLTMDRRLYGSCFAQLRLKTI